MFSIGAFVYLVMYFIGPGAERGLVRMESPFVLAMVTATLSGLSLWRGSNSQEITLLMKRAAGLFLLSTVMFVGAGFYLPMAQLTSQANNLPFYTLVGFWFFGATNFSIAAFLLLIYVGYLLDLKIERALITKISPLAPTVSIVGGLAAAVLAVLAAMEKLSLSKHIFDYSHYILLVTCLMIAIFASTLTAKKRLRQ